MKRQKKCSQLQALKKKKTISCIENFSIEIFCEIFDYLDGYDISKAFSNLNIRLENLLMNSSLSMKCQIFSKTRLSFDYRQFINSTKDHIISLEFDTQSRLDKFLRFFTIDSFFSRLESLILNSISTYTLYIVLFYLKSLPRLSSLSLCLTHCSDDIGPIYQMIFYFSLKYFRIAIPRHPYICLTIPVAAENHFSSIEYLIIYHRCTINQLTQILSHTPRLCRLHCFNVIESNDDDDVKSKLTIKLNYLTHLAMTLRGLEFDEFVEFLLKLCSQLKVLSVKIYSTDESYLDANRWERLISKKITSLTRFIFRYNKTIDDDFVITSYHSLINRFTSSFWIDRQWIFKVLIEEDELIYSINPYQENWFDFQEYLYINQDPKTNTDHFSNRYVSSVELYVSGTFLTENDEPLMKKIHPIFHMIKITYLDIECDEMTVSTLIQILYTLRNLKSIEISNSLLHQHMPIKTQDKIMLKRFLNINKLTKISLRNVTEQEQIDFIFRHFRRIQFFGLHRVRDVQLKSIARNLLSNINSNKIFHPMTLCIVCDDAVYDKMEQLHQMIDTENLLKNYTICRQYDKFYIKWK